MSHRLVFGLGEGMCWLALALLLASMISMIIQGFRKNAGIGLAMILFSPFSYGVFLVLFFKEYPKTRNTFLGALLILALAMLPLLYAKHLREQGGPSDELVALVRDVRPFKQSVEQFVREKGRWPTREEVPQLAGGNKLDGIQRAFFSSDDHAWLRLSSDSYAGAPVVEFRGLLSKDGKSWTWSCLRSMAYACTPMGADIQLVNH